METWEDRLKKETTELAEKVNKLQDFMRTKVFYELSRAGKDLLYAQLEHMLKYLQVLGKRCESSGTKLDSMFEEKHTSIFNIIKD